MKQMFCMVLAAVMVTFGTQGLADAAPLLTGLNESQFVAMSADVDEVVVEEVVEEEVVEEVVEEEVVEEVVEEEVVEEEVVEVEETVEDEEA